MMLFAMSMACLGQDIRQLLNSKSLAKTAAVSKTFDDFDITGYYDYDNWESALRVSYSVLLVSAHIKILNVLSFYDSVAFLVKIMENLVTAIIPLISFLFFIIAMFTFSISALDVTF